MRRGATGGSRRGGYRGGVSFAAAGALLLGCHFHHRLGAAAFLVPAPQQQRHQYQRAAATRLFHTPPSSSGSPPAPAVAEPQTDASVPEAHKGLHNFLYDKGEAAAHAGDGGGYVQFTRGTVHDATEWLGRYGPEAKVAGVYGVYDSGRRLRFVGVSRNVGLSLQAHAQAQGAAAVAGVAVQSFRFPKREEMLNYQAIWLAELASAPEGNTPEGAAGWAASIKEAVEAGGADAAQRAQYEEGKVKLRTAMADPSLADDLDDLDESGYDEDGDAMAAAARRAQLKAAVEGNGDDWSAEINRQTQATMSAAAAAAAPAAGAVVSPFNDGKKKEEDGGKPKAVLPSGEEALELTPANVDKVLDEVRPYLISDGGNIEVVRVETDTRNIYLRLQGACGSCPSSTTTMKMGVERVLREKFANLGVVEAVEPLPEGAAEGDAPLSPQEALRQKIEGKLGEILPAIRGLGAAAAVEEVTAEGVVTMSFKGPEKVKLGVVYALKALPGVAEVKTV